MSSSPSVTTGVEATQAPQQRSAMSVIRGFIALTKPRIIELLLVTTIPTMVLAANGWPSLWLMVSTFIGGTISAGAANTFNMYIDRDIDAVMKRTANRPLVTGAVTPRQALIFAWVLAVGSTAWFLWVVGSPLAALLSVLAILGYAVGYSLLLKRRTSQNIVWGGAAGAMPVLIGWAAVTESLSWAPVLLFLFIFFWTPPHYWPLAMRFRSDYSAVNVPMLPVVASNRRVSIEMIVYAVVMVVVSLALIPVAGMTWIYAGAALLSGLWFVGGCVTLYRRSERGEPKLREMRLFRDSILYLTIVFAAVMVDPFLPDALTIFHS